MAQAVPQSICDRAKLLSTVHTWRDVCAILKISSGTLVGIKRRNWQATRVGPRFRPMPTDFAIMSKRMTGPELVIHYRCSHRAITRWRKELRG